MRAPLSIGLKTSRFFVCKFVNLQTKCGAPPAAGKSSAWDGSPAKGARIDGSGGVGRCLTAFKMFIFCKIFYIFLQYCAKMFGFCKKVVYNNKDFRKGGRND